MLIDVSPVGATALTVMPNGVRSDAQLRVTARTAAFDALYAARRGRPKAAVEQRFTIEPRPSCFIARAALLPHANVPSTFASSTDRTSASDSAHGSLAVHAPAALT